MFSQCAYRQNLCVLFFICLWSCSHTVYSENEKTTFSSSKVNRASANIQSQKKSDLYKTINLKVAKGGVALLELPFSISNEEIDDYKLNCEQEITPFFVANAKVKAILAESYFSTRRNYRCKLEWIKTHKDVIEAKIDVVSKKYPFEKLHVNQKTVVLSRKDQIRVSKEQEILNQIYTHSNKDKLFDHNFFSPLDSKITSSYGTQRIYNHMKKSQHLGIDYRAKLGTPVKLSNAGRVVFAGDLFFTGHTVIVDHGLGVFTVYGHLSQVYVKEGSLLDRQQIIGLSGQSGRVNGPHLHWGVKVRGNWVDGSDLIKIAI